MKKNQSSSRVQTVYEEFKTEYFFLKRNSLFKIILLKKNNCKYKLVKKSDHSIRDFVR